MTCSPGRRSGRRSRSRPPSPRPTGRRPSSPVIPSSNESVAVSVETFVGPAGRVTTACGAVRSMWTTGPAVAPAGPVEVPSVTLFAARASVTVPSVGAAEERDTVYGPAPLPVTSADAPAAGRPADVEVAGGQPRHGVAEPDGLVEARSDADPRRPGHDRGRRAGRGAVRGDQAGDVQPFAGRGLAGQGRRRRRGGEQVGPELGSASGRSCRKRAGRARP